MRRIGMEFEDLDLDLYCSSYHSVEKRHVDVGVVAHTNVVKLSCCSGLWLWVWVLAGLFVFTFCVGV